MAKLSKKTRARRELSKDIFFIFLGAAIAWFLSATGLIDAVIRIFGNQAIASFVAGVFFTSVFTIAPASVALAHIAASGDAWTITLFGALGALCGDLMLFFFIRDRFTDDLIGSIRPSLMKHIMSSLHVGFMKWLGPLLGGIVIFSPLLPDEVGLTLMGLSKTRVLVLIPISFSMNILAVYSIIWFAHFI